MLEQSNTWNEEVLDRCSKYAVLSGVGTVDWTWADFVVALYSDGKGGRLKAMDVRMGCGTPSPS